MGLDLIPTHDPCQLLGNLSTLKGVSVRVDKSFTCPLKGVSKIQGMLGTHCWCRGKVAAADLDALGYEKESSRMYEDFSPDEAIEFGDKLLAIAEKLRKRHAKHLDKPLGAEYVSTVGEAIEGIEDAGHWFVAVGNIGSGVHAWA